MGLCNRLCKRFFAAVIIRLTAQSDSRAHQRIRPVVTNRKIIRARREVGNECIAVLSLYGEYQYVVRFFLPWCFSTL